MKSVRYKILFGVYVLLGLILLPFYQYRINPDAISYFNIAQNYLIGSNTINGFWSPLLSWLLVPFFLFHITPPFAFSIIQLIFGFFTLIGIKRLSHKFPMQENMLFLTLLSFVPLVLYFVYGWVITPDLLSLCFLLFYLDTVLSERVNGTLAGVYGAFAYFAKTYSLLFFLVHFIVLMLYKKDAKNLLKGLVTCLLIILPWIGLISVKYHHFTVGNAGTYNFQTSR